MLWSNWKTKKEHVSYKQDLFFDFSQITDILLQTICFIRLIKTSYVTFLKRDCLLHSQSSKLIQEKKNIQTGIFKAR